MTETALRSPIQELAAKPTRRRLQSELATVQMLHYLITVPDPDEMLLKAGIKRHQLRQLELDDEVAQCVDTRREAVIATPWRIEPNQTKVGKWLTETLHPHIEDMRRGVMDARFYGYSVQEIIFDPSLPKIGIKRLSLKPMEWFAPQRDGTLRYFPEDGSGGFEGIECPEYKFLLSRCNASYRNPYGEALLSRLWFPVTWRREGWGLWLQFMETFGEPIILGMVNDYKSFVEAMTAQGVRSTVAWQSVNGEDKVQPINASTPGEFERLEQALIRRIEKLILGQTLTSDVGSKGSYAAAAVHNEVRNDKRRADLRMDMAAGQKLVNILCTLNSIAKPWPKYICADDSGLETPRAQRDAILSPVLTSNKLSLSREYFLRNYDYTVEDLVEVAEEPMLDPSSFLPPNLPPSNDAAPVSKTEIGKKKAVKETGEKRPPVKDRSIVDQTGPNKRT